jgi:hypothetical protein
MKILLWAPEFFGYDKQIKDALVSMGHKVYMVHDRPFKSAFLRAITTRFPNIIGKILTPYYKRKIKIIHENLDFVLVINGQTLTPSILGYIKSKNNNAHMILYLWDSIRNRKNVINNFREFDKILSFDLADCEQFGITYRPLFYSSNFNQPFKSNGNKTYSNFVVGFLGTIHSDRLDVIDKFASCNPLLTLKKFMYLHERWVFILKYLTNKTFRLFKKDDFNYYSLTLDESADFLSRCDAVLDIEHSNQTGLTIRTLECIGLNKKLITTNKSVFNHDFFDSNSVFVIDRDHPVVSQKFQNGGIFKGFSDHIRTKYSLEGWIDEVFDFE